MYLLKYLRGFSKTNSSEIVISFVNNGVNITSLLYM